MDTQQTRGTRLRAARGTRTLDQAAAAYELTHGKERGVSRTTISKWEHDERWPNLVILDRYCQALGADVAVIDPDSFANLAAIGGRYAPRDSNPQPSDSALKAA